MTARRRLTVLAFIVRIFGRLGSRPLNLQEQQKLYLRNGEVYTVTDEPPRPPKN
jgi:hypothetical protein